jgi:hypothetical protein
MTTPPVQDANARDGVAIERLQRKLQAMHRRAQIAEAALGDYRRIIAMPPDGDGVRFISGSMGRALLAAYCNQLLARIDDLHESLRAVYDAVPPLPITAETEDAATDALHALCLIIGIHQVDVGPPAHAPSDRQESTSNG